MIQLHINHIKLYNFKLNKKKLRRWFVFERISLMLNEYFTGKEDKSNKVIILMFNLVLLIIENNILIN